MPGLKFHLGFVEGSQAHFLPKMWLEVKPVEAGKTLDLGDIRVKPPREDEPAAEDVNALKPGERACDHGTDDTAR